MLLSLGIGDDVPKITLFAGVDFTLVPAQVALP